MGSGVASLKAKRIPRTSDPSNFGAKQLDFFVYRIDGTAVRLYLGKHRSSSGVPAQVLQNTLEELHLIPQVNRLSCQDAFNHLISYPLGSTIDLTDEFQFPWPNFIANFGRLMPDIMGAGSISNVSLVDVQSNRVILTLTRSDEIKVRVSLVKYERRDGPVVKPRVQWM